MIVAARRACQRDQQVAPQPALGRLGEDMQPVADLHLLQLAEIIVDRGERVVAPARGPRVAIEPDALGEIEDVALQPLEPARVHAGGKIIFVDQRFELLERSVALRPRQRRRQVIDDGRRDPALGLRPLARIVDDEGIDLRQRPCADLGEAGLRERHRLARQPFQIAMLADMDDGMGAELPVQPDVESEIPVRRRERRVMVAGLGIDIVAARRLHRDRDIAEAVDGKPEGSVPHEWIGLRIAPAFRDGGACGVRQGVESLTIGAQAQSDLAGPIKRAEVVGHPARHQPHQRGAVLWGIADGIARLAKRPHDRRGARRRIETDAVADPAVAIGIVGKHERDPPLGGRQGAQPRPVGGEVGDERDAIGEHLRHDDAAFGQRIEALGRLEGHRAGEQPPVQLRQSDVHGEVARSEPSRVACPALQVHAGDDDLEDRAVRTLQYTRRARLAGGGGGEGGGIEDDIRCHIVQYRVEPVAREGLPQRADMDGDAVQSARVQAGQHRIHSLQRTGEHEGAIEDQDGDRSAFDPACARIVQRRALDPRHV